MLNKQYTNMLQEKTLSLKYSSMLQNVPKSLEQKIFMILALVTLLYLHLLL